MMKYESKRWSMFIHYCWSFDYIMIIKGVGQTINYLGIIVKAAISLAIFAVPIINFNSADNYY